MPTLTEFRTQFSEFRAVPEALLSAMLAAAALECDETVWGKLYAQGVMYLAAHKLATSPYGNTAKLSDAGGGSTYFGTYSSLVLKVATGFRVT